jgi:1,4-alpha-glucan branching enzyme
MFTHPGKKLLMAGSELGTWNEWHHESSLELHLLQYQVHDEISRLMADLGKLYISDNSLWKWDHKHEGFSWIDCNDYLSSVLSYIRRGPDGYLVCVCNFTPVVRKDYRVGVPEPGMFREVINSDSEYYGGSNVGNGEIVSTVSGPQHGYDQYLNLVLPPLFVVSENGNRDGTFLVESLGRRDWPIRDLDVPVGSG